MSIKRHVILNHVDTPLKILFWTVPELLMLVVPCFVGLIIDQLMLGLFVSGIYYWGSKKYQQYIGKGQLQAFKYWYFPSDSRYKTLPCSYVREYIG